MPPIQTTDDVIRLRTFRNERERQKIDQHIERSTQELAQSETDLLLARKQADSWVIREDEARETRDQLTREFDKRIAELFEVFTQATLARNHVIAMSNENRRARQQLDNAIARLTNPS